MNITFTVIKTTKGNYYLYNNKVCCLENNKMIVGTQHFKEEFGVEPTYLTFIDDYEADVRLITSIEDITMPIVHS